MGVYFEALISSRFDTRFIGGKEEEKEEEEGPHNKRNGNVSRYFLPRFFLSTTDALRTEPRRSAVSNNGWKKEEETRCPAQIYREAPPAPIYIHTASRMIFTKRGNIFLENGWLCYCCSFHRAGNDLVGFRGKVGNGIGG